VPASADSAASAASAPGARGAAGERPGAGPPQDATGGRATLQADLVDGTFSVSGRAHPALPPLLVLSGHAASLPPY